MFSINKKILPLFCFILLTIFFQNSGQAAIIGDETKKTPTGYYQIDSVFQLESDEPIEDYRKALNHSNWSPYYNLIPRLKNDNQWYRFFINNQSDIEQWNILFNKEVISENFEMYVVKDNTTIHKFNNDNVTAIGPYKTLSPPLTLEENSFYTVLIKEKSLDFSPFNIVMTEQFSLQGKYSQFNLIEGLIVGLIFSMLFYNFSLFTKTRHQSYLYYTLFHSLILVFQLYSLGLLPDFMFNNILDNEQRLYIAATTLVFIGGHLFTLKFLNIKNTLKPFFIPIFCSLFLWSAFLFLRLIFMDNVYLNYVFGFLSALSFSLAVIVGCFLWGKGHGEAKYYTLAWLSFVIFYGLDKLSSLNVLPFYLNDLYLKNFGLVCEAILMSIAPLEIMKQLQEKNELKSNKIEQDRIDTQMKSDFLSSMTHEIKTPMNGVLGVTDLLKNTELTQEQEEYIETINSSGKNLMNIIEDILNYSRSESGNVQIEMYDFRFNEMIDDVVSIFRTRYFDTKIPLFFEIDPDIPNFVRGDCEKIKQVLINLISNAYKFTKEGQIVLKAVYEGRGTSCRHQIRFDVVDSGIGLTEEEKNNLFSPFQQANESITRKYGGTGLGLAISKNIVQLMNGDINIDSVKGQGSRFGFSIDLKESLNTSYRENWLDISQLQQSKILLLSKNQYFVNGITSTFKRHGIDINTIQTVNNKDDIINSIQEHDIIYIDKMFNDEILTTIENNASKYSYKTVLICQRFSRKSDFNEIEKVFTTDKLIISAVKTLKNEILHNISEKQKEKRENNHEYNNEQNTESNQPNVLIAEDDKATQIILKKQIKNLNAKPVVCDNGENAFYEFKNNPHYDLIITDYQMPLMNGYQLTQKIRQFENKRMRPAKPIIGLSADEASFNTEDYYSIGGNQCLNKPLGENELQIIAQYLKKTV